MPSLTGSPQIAVPNTSDKCVQTALQIVLGGMNFDGTGTITYNFAQAGIAFRPGNGVRAIYFDARNLAGGDALIQFVGGPTLRLPLGKQGWIPVFMPGPVTLAITSAAGNGPLTVFLANFKVYPIIW